MAEQRRDPQQTKEIGIKRMIESYEKTNRKVCSPAKKREFEKLYEKKVLPNVYGK